MYNPAAVVCVSSSNPLNMKYWTLKHKLLMVKMSIIIWPQHGHWSRSWSESLQYVWCRDCSENSSRCPMTHIWQNDSSSLDYVQVFHFNWPLPFLRPNVPRSGDNLPGCWLSQPAWWLSPADFLFIELGLRTCTRNISAPWGPHHHHQCGGNP